MSDDQATTLAQPPFSEDAAWLEDAQPGIFANASPYVIVIDATTGATTFLDYRTGVMELVDQHPPACLFERLVKPMEDMSDALREMARSVAYAAPAWADCEDALEACRKGWRSRCSVCSTGLPRMGGSHSDNLCRHCRRKRWASGRGSRGRRARRAGRRPARNSGPR